MPNFTCVMSKILRDFFENIDFKIGFFKNQKFKIQFVYHYNFNYIFVAGGYLEKTSRSNSSQSSNRPLEGACLKQQTIGLWKRRAGVHQKDENGEVGKIRGMW